MTTQQEIDDLLGSESDYHDKSLRSNIKNNHNISKESEVSYDQDFENYDESRKQESVSYKSDFELESKSDNKIATSYRKQNFKQEIQESIASNSVYEESMPRTEYEESRQSKGVSKKLAVIKEEQQTPNRKVQQTNSGNLNKKKPQQGGSKSKPPRPEAVNQNYLPYNFTKLRDLEKERLLTDLVEEMTKIKNENNKLQMDIKHQVAKYNALLEQKMSTNDKAKEELLVKQNNALKARIESLILFKKKHLEENSFKKLSATQQQLESTAPVKQQDMLSTQQLPANREADLLRIIDKLKDRLKESQDQLKALQMKMNEGLDFQEHYKKQVRVVQQLEYKVSKLNDQAENDRLLIEQLKLKWQDTEKKLQEERDKNTQLSKEFRRIQLSIATNNDLVKELEATRNEKNRLQNSLKELTTTLVPKALQKTKTGGRGLQPFGHIDALDFQSIR